MARGGRERKKFFYEIGSYAAFHLTWLSTQVPTTFSILSRELADSGESNFQSEIWEEVGREAITDSEHQGLKKKALTPEPRNWIPWGCMWQRAQWLFKLFIFLDLSLNSSFSSFCSVFLLLSLSFSSGRFSFLSSFLPTSFHFPCLFHLLSLFVYIASLPLSRQNLKPK